MGLEDLTTLDATYPKGDIEPVSVLDNYQRETRAKLKAWAAKEHDLVTGHHIINTVPAYPAVGRMYYDKITGELRYWMPGPPGANAWRSVLQPPFNYILNPEFKMMSNGLTSVPSGWSWSGGAGQVVFQDSIVRYFTKNSIKLSSPGNSTVHYIFTDITANNTQYSPIDYWRGRTVSFGCYVLSTVASKAYIQINDGIQQVDSPFQLGGSGGWEWCEVTATLSAGATLILTALICAPHTAAYDSWFSLPTFVEGAWCTRPTPQGHPQRSHILTFNSQNGAFETMIGTNYYGQVGRNANPYYISTIIPYRYCIRGLRVYSAATAPSGQTLDFSVYYNSTTSSNINCQIAGSATSAFNDVDTFIGDANSTVSLRCIGSGAAQPNSIAASIYIDELPW